MTELIAALVGALLGGGIQAWNAHLDRNRLIQSTTEAIVSEVVSLCELIRHQRYLEVHEAAVAAIDNETWDGKTWIIDVRSNYFSVYEGLTSNLGLLPIDRVRSIVRFYAYCRSVIDSTRPDGPSATDDNPETKAAGLVSTSILLKEILALGDVIASYGNGEAKQLVEKK